MSAEVRVWHAPDTARMEFCEVELGEESLSARGVQLGVEPLPYRLEYELETASRWVTSRLEVRSWGNGWSRTLSLGRDGSGAWSATGGGEGDALPPAGGETGPYAEALDCDLGLCPLTNTMPILREGLLDGSEARDFVMAWVSVPDLAVSRSEQRYEPVSSGPDGAVVRYVGRHRSFVGELEVDRLGLVVRYPELAERVGG